MKWSLADWCSWRPAPGPAAYFRRIRDLGVEAMEMVPPDRRAAARAAGLKLLNIAGPGMQQGLNHREHHAELLPSIRKAVEEATREDIPHVIVFSGNRAGQSHQEGISQCAEGLAKLVPAARDAGITLLLEILNSYDHRDYAADHTGYAAKVVRAVDSPHVKILYDVYHAARMGLDVSRDLEERLPLIGHFHVAEPPDRSVPRAGSTVRWNELAQQAERGGYKGFWGLEFCRRDGDLLEQVPAAMATLGAGR